MINKIKISENAELVFSKGECGYEDVINDFNNANIIKVITFNISLENTRILEKIRKVKDTVSVEIITNIPNRYATYFSSTARNRAKKNIDSYINQLDPEKFNPIVYSYFNFGNHSKIILTENIAYIGSANASDESASNFEAGIILKEKKVIREVIDKIIPILKDDSEEYYGDNLSKIRILILNLLTRIRRLKEEFHFSFYSINDHRGANIEFYNSRNADLSATLCEELRNFLYEYDDMRNELEELEEELSMIELEEVNVDDFNELLNELYEFSNYNINDKVSEYLEEYSYIAYEENLNEYAEMALQRASDEKNELAEGVQENVVELERRLKIMLENLMRVYEDLEQFKEVNDDVDNT